MSLVCLCLAAVFRPSIPGGLYFIVFLSAATWWACYKDLGRAFAIVLRVVAVVVIIHIGTLFSAQMQWFQNFLPQNATYSRYRKYCCEQHVAAIHFFYVNKTQF